MNVMKRLNQLAPLRAQELREKLKDKIEDCFVIHLYNRHPATLDLDTLEGLRDEYLIDLASI